METKKDKPFLACQLLPDPVPVFNFSGLVLRFAAFSRLV